MISKSSTMSEEITEDEFTVTTTTTTITVSVVLKKKTNIKETSREITLNKFIKGLLDNAEDNEASVNKFYENKMR